MLNFNMIIRSLQSILTKVRYLPTYAGLSEVDSFLERFEKELLEKQRFEALNWVFPTMLMWWWGTHKGSFDVWCKCIRMMHT